MPVKGTVTSLGEMCEFNPYIPGQRERNSPKDSLETFFFWLCWVLLLGLSLVTASRGYAVVVEHRLRMSRLGSCPETCGVCLN